MAPDYRQVELFGGAITANLPSAYVDVSDIRQVPDHQEVWLDKDGFTSIVVEILERVEKQDDIEALKYHLEDIVQEDWGDMQIWSSNQAHFAKLPQNTAAYTLIATSPPGETQRGRKNEPDFVGISLTMIRLAQQETDLIIAINVPHVSGGYQKDEVDPASGKQGKLLEEAEEIRKCVMASFEVKDWSLFVQDDD